MRGFRTLGRIAVTAALGAALAACGGVTSGEVSEADAARIAALQDRLDALEAQVVEAEDVAAIKRLMRTYGFYLDRGLWEDLSDLFTEDARGNYPAGVFIGRESLYPHFLENNGRGYVGFEEGRLGNHIVLQPVIDVAEDGVTAEGRWRVVAQLGQYGQSANWAGGIYEIDYRKDDGVWKISSLDYYSVFGAPYATGWGSAPPAEAGAATTERRQAIFRNLPRPPDEPRVEHQGVPPFHYDNPVTGRPFVAEDWYEEEGE